MAGKALLVGVNEYRKFPPLKGCIHDVADVEALLLQNAGFEARNIRTLLDERATASELNKQLKWLSSSTRPGDHAIFYFAGCGSYIGDTEGHELTGRARILCPYDLDFKDSASYLTESDLRRWMRNCPEGVNAVAILDLCHDGQGTRLVHSVNVDETILLDIPCTLRRAAAKGHGLSLPVAMSALDPDEPDVVGARFIFPPGSIQEKARILSQKRSLGPNIPAEFLHGPNQLLVAACQHNQTACEAQFLDESRGAFTYHLCKILRDRGADLDPDHLMISLAQALSAGHFDQTPRLEPAQPACTIIPIPPRSAVIHSEPPSLALRPASAPPILLHDPAAGPTDAEAVAAILHWISSPDNPLPARLKNRVVDLMESTLNGPNQPLATVAEVPRRCLICVPDAGSAAAGFSDRWWAALKEHTSAYGDGGPITRRELLWNQVTTNDQKQPESTGALNFLARVTGALEDRAARFTRNANPGAARPELLQWLATHRAKTAETPSMLSLDLSTISQNLLDPPSHDRILAHFHEVVATLLRAGCEIDVISHGWGSVVAYEGLHRLNTSHQTGRVRNFFTLGAALSLLPVQQRLQEHHDAGSRPAVVHRWININASGDPLGGPIQNHPFQVDLEYLETDSPECKSNPDLAHQSYFDHRNSQVNQQILAYWINQP